MVRPLRDALYVICLVCEFITNIQSIRNESGFLFFLTCPPPRLLDPNNIGSSVWWNVIVNEHYEETKNRLWRSSEAHKSELSRPQHAINWITHRMARVYTPLKSLSNKEYLRVLPHPQSPYIRLYSGKKPPAWISQSFL